MNGQSVQINQIMPREQAPQLLAHEWQYAKQETESAAVRRIVQDLSILAAHQSLALLEEAFGVHEEDSWRRLRRIGAWSVRPVAFSARGKGVNVGVVFGIGVDVGVKWQMVTILILVQDCIHLCSWDIRF